MVPRQSCRAFQAVRVWGVLGVKYERKHYRSNLHWFVVRTEDQRSEDRD